MMPDASVSTSTAAEGSEPEVPETAWSTAPWYQTSLGLGVITLDIALTVGLALGTAGFYENMIAAIVQGESPVVPLAIYGFAILGALGFVFTALIDEFECTALRLLRYNMRLPAAIPLGAGVYVLSGIILGTTASDLPATENLVIGLVFVSGLYVNLAYKRLGAIAKRLLPEENEQHDEGSADAGKPTVQTETDSLAEAPMGDSPETPSRASATGESPDTGDVDADREETESERPQDVPPTG